MSLELEKEDREICPECGERALVIIDRWGNIKKECLMCDYEELLTPSCKNPEHKTEAVGCF